MRLVGRLFWVLISLSVALNAAEPTINELKSKALAGDTEAQMQLGARYDFGRGVQQNYQEAAKWYELSAKAGNAHGQNNLGSFYLEGLGVKKDYAKALEWFQKAAAQGEASAECSIGLMIEKGWSSKKMPRWVLPGT